MWMHVGFVPSLPQPSAREASIPTPPPGWQKSSWLRPVTSTARHAVRGADVGGGAHVWRQADRAAGATPNTGAWVEASVGRKE